MALLLGPHVNISLSGSFFFDPFHSMCLLIELQCDIFLSYAQKMALHMWAWKLKLIEEAVQRGNFLGFYCFLYCGL